MRFYRCDYRDPGYSSHGYSFHTSMRNAEETAEAAKKRTKDNGAESIADVEIETVDIKPTKKGILAALNTYGKHADNG